MTRPRWSSFVLCPWFAAEVPTSLASVTGSARDKPTSDRSPQRRSSRNYPTPCAHCAAARVRARAWVESRSRASGTDPRWVRLFASSALRSRASGTDPCWVRLFASSALVCLVGRRYSAWRGLASHRSCCVRVPREACERHHQLRSPGEIGIRTARSQQRRSGRKQRRLSRLLTNQSSRRVESPQSLGPEQAHLFARIQIEYACIHLSYDFT